MVKGGSMPVTSHLNQNLQKINPALQNGQPNFSLDHNFIDVPSRSVSQGVSGSKSEAWAANTNK